MKKVLSRLTHLLGHLLDEVKNLFFAAMWHLLYGRDWWLYLGILLTMVWELFPSDQVIKYPLVDHSQKANWWAYLLGQHLNLICISMFMYRTKKSYLTAAYLATQIMFMIDYVLRYNFKYHLYFFNQDITFNYNHIFIIIMAVFIWGLKKLY